MAYKRQRLDSATEIAVRLGGKVIMYPEEVPSSIIEIAPILHVANGIESFKPRVAYLCLFYAFEKAHTLDPTSSGRGVRQFEATLFQRLDRSFQQQKATLGGRGKSDAHEMQAFYQHYVKCFVDLQNTVKLDRNQFTKAYQSATVLFEVLNFVSQYESVKVTDEILKAHNEFGEMAEMPTHNVLPLNHENSDQALVRHPEIFKEHREFEEKVEMPTHNVHPLDPESSDQELVRHPEILKEHREFGEKAEMSTHNVLSPDPDSSDQALVRHPEVSSRNHVYSLKEKRV